MYGNVNSLASPLFNEDEAEGLKMIICNVKGVADAKQADETLSASANAKGVQ